MLKLKKIISVVAILSLVTTNLANHANASSLTGVSDALSNSDLSQIATHTVRFTINTALINTDYVDVVMPAGFGTSTFTTGCFSSSTASYVSSRIYRCSVTSAIATGTQLTVSIANISNPVTSGSQTITITSYTTGAVVKETASAMVAVIDNVNVSASVPATLTFSITSVATGTKINGATTTASTASSSAVSFGNLQIGTSSIIGQQLSVTTNAAGGYSVTVQQNQDLTSSGGSKIATYANGSATTTIWTNPTGTLDATSTYGHFGFTSNDWTLAAGDTFGATSTPKYTGFSGTTPVEVMYHTGASDGTTIAKGMAQVAYRIHITALQPAGDYSNILTYIATPTY
ncbi:MAG: hypothetical protein WCG01_00510 [bacterium]